MESVESAEIKEKLADALFKWARLPAKLIPKWIEAAALGAVIAQTLEKRPALKERLCEVEGKLFCFEAIDIGKKFYLNIKAGVPKVAPHVAREPDVVMRGEVKVLLGVLRGTEDPDTVFFSRKLEINGDTAAALHLKNILNSL